MWMLQLLLLASGGGAASSFLFVCSGSFSPRGSSASFIANQRRRRCNIDSNEGDAAVAYCSRLAFAPNHVRITRDSTTVGLSIIHQTNNNDKNNNDSDDNDGDANNKDIINIDNDSNVDGFTLLIQKAIRTLIESDAVEGQGAYSSRSATGGTASWLDVSAGKELQEVLDRLVLKLPLDSSPDPPSAPFLSPQEKRQFYDQRIKNEQHSKWLQWMKTTPSPLVLDLTPHVHQLIAHNYNTFNNNQHQSNATTATTPTTSIAKATTSNNDPITNNVPTNNKQQQPWISTSHLEQVKLSLEQYTSRIACHVILLPSGSETAPLSLVETTGAHVYGKLLYGGVKRFRLLTSGGSGGAGGVKRMVRRVGEQREVMKATMVSLNNNSNAQQHQQQQQQQQSSSSSRKKQYYHSHPSWLQLGGVERRYEAIDMGSGAVLELTLLPKLWQDLPNVFDKSVIMKENIDFGEMTLSNAALGWDPSMMLTILPKGDDSVDDGENAETNNMTEKNDNNSATDAFQSLDGKQRNDALTTQFQSRVGGLQPQIDAIVRRVLDGRSIYSHHSDDQSTTTKTASAITKAKLEAQELASLGLQPVRGLLLYGKPGTGKTLLVREIARSLGARPPKIVAASELLDRWVGGSERYVRELFKEAEEEMTLCRIAAGSGGEDEAFLRSALHVIVIDEIDAVFRKRIDSSDSGAITRNSITNQLLAKLDGVHSLPNVLMIGMTNRKELLDDALLRPGRLEVQVEVPLPNKDGRREILQIHFGPLRKKGRLSDPLCCAIDGVRMDALGMDSTVEPNTKKNDGKRSKLKKMLRPLSMVRGSSATIDLADDECTFGYSGADIAGLVRNSGSIALARARVDGGGIDGLLVTLEDVKQALTEAIM